MPKLPDLPSTPAGNGSQITIGYRIEARNSIFEQTHKAYIYGDKAITNLWTEIEMCIGDNPAGVPIATFPWEGLIQHRLLPYESAVALAHTFLAQYFMWSALEVRIVGYKLETTYNLSNLGPVGGVIAKSYKNPKFVSEKELEEKPNEQS